MQSPLLKRRRTNHLVLLAVALLVAVAPLLVTGGYYRAILVTVGLFAIFGMGLQITLGTGGILNMGHAAFIAVGAYTSGIITVRGGSAWLGMLAGSLLALALALLVGLPILRLKSLYLAIATLCFALIVTNVLGFSTELTGGHVGLIGIPPFALGPMVFSSLPSQIYLVWAVLLLAMLIRINLRFSAVGREFEALKDSELAAATLGVNFGLRKLQIFALGSVLGAIGGSLYGSYVFAVTPDLFNFGFLVRIFVLVAVGGMLSLWGAPVGALVAVLITEFLLPVLSGGKSGPVELVIFGVILVVIMIFAPNGVIDELSTVVRRLRARKRSRSPQPAVAEAVAS